MALRWYFTLSILALLATIVSACTQPEPTPIPTPTLTPVPAPTSTPTPTPTPTLTPLLETTALIKRVVAAMVGLDSLHFESELVVKATKEAKDDLLSVQVNGKREFGGDSQVLTSITVKNELGAETVFSFETRMVDGIRYAQNPINSEWAINEESESSDADFPLTLLKKLLNLEEIEVEVDDLDGVPVYRITGSVPADPEAERLVLWVGLDDFLIHQTQIEGHAPARDYQGLVPQDLHELFKSSLYQFSGFNEPVEVIAPS